MIGPSACRVSSSAHTMDFRRRQFFKTALGGVLTTLSGCAAHDRNLSHCPAAVSDFELSEALGPLPVYRCKAAPGRRLFCYTSWRACRLRISPWRNVWPRKDCPFTCRSCSVSRVKTASSPAIFNPAPRPTSNVPRSRQAVPSSENCAMFVEGSANMRAVLWASSACVSPARSRWRCLATESGQQCFANRRCLSTLCSCAPSARRDGCWA